MDDDVGDALAGAAVTVWVFHPRRGALVLEQTHGFLYDEALVGADQARDACLDGLRPLRHLAHDEHGRAEARRFFLNPTRVGDRKRGTAQREQQVEIIERRGEPDAWMPAQYFLRGDRKSVV